MTKKALYPDNRPRLSRRRRRDDHGCVGQGTGEINLLPPIAPGKLTQGDRLQIPDV
jgi:hypothetical protein